MQIDRVKLQEEFKKRLDARWAKGAKEYGDASFGESPAATTEQILQEIEDIAGWAFVLWVQMLQRVSSVLQKDPMVVLAETAPKTADGAVDLTVAYCADCRGVLRGLPAEPPRTSRISLHGLRGPRLCVACARPLR